MTRKGQQAFVSEIVNTPFWTQWDYAERQQREAAQANISFSGARLHISALDRPDYILKCHFAPPPPPPHETETPRFVLMKARFAPYYVCSRAHFVSTNNPHTPADVVFKTAPANFLTAPPQWRKVDEDGVLATACCGLTGKVGSRISVVRGMVGGGEESLLGKVGFVILAETIVENFYISLSEHFLMRFLSIFVE